MAEEGGELGHPPVDVLASVIPVKQRADGHRVAQVMRSRAHALAGSF